MDGLFQIVVNISLSASIVMLTALMYQLHYSVTKFSNLIHGAIITIGAYGTYFFYQQCLLPFGVSIVFSLITAAVIGTLCELLVYKPMREKKATSQSYLVASIGLYVILQNAISLLFGDDTKMLNKAEIQVGHQFFSAYITGVQIVIIIVSNLLFLAIILFMRFTKLGKSIRAVASNAELCNIYGIPSNKIILIVFSISSVLAAVIGILSAMDTSMNPFFGFYLLLYGVVAMIIGGVGSTKNLVLAAVIVSSCQHLVAYYIGAKWMDSVTYLMLIVFLIWKPLGFSGKRIKKMEV